MYNNSQGSEGYTSSRLDFASLLSVGIYLAGRKPSISNLETEILRCQPEKQFWSILWSNYILRMGRSFWQKNIFLRVCGPEKVCIIGDNGAGKTTLLHKIKDELLDRDDIKAGYMPQNYEELLDLDQTPIDYLNQTGAKEERTRIQTFLGAMKYTVDKISS